MPSVIEGFLIELKLARDFEKDRITGFEEILAFPDVLLSLIARTEVLEAHTWSVKRYNLILNVISTVIALIEDLYPRRDQQIAPEIVIEELKSSLAKFQLAVAEFEAPLTGSSTISEEIPV
jgi:hypothetical protein